MTLLLVALAVSVHAATVDRGKVKELYDQAFRLYQGGEYKQAIQTYNEVLKLDPEQKSARQMIEEVRERVAALNREKRAGLFGIIRQGKYRRALADIQALIEEDPSNPTYQTLLSQLESVSAIVPEAPALGKAWRAATLGLSGLLAQRPDLKLAYNGLRYAAELDPKDAQVRRLLEWFESKHPEHAASDPVTPGMTLLEYKRYVGLNHIYDEKPHRAVEALSEVLALEPEDLTALKRLGTAYYSMGRHDKAKEAWSKALKLGPEDPQLKKFLRKAESAADIPPPPP